MKEIDMINHLRISIKDIQYSYENSLDESLLDVMDRLEKVLEELLGRTK